MKERLLYPTGNLIQQTENLYSIVFESKHTGSAANVSVNHTYGLDALPNKRMQLLSWQFEWLLFNDTVGVYNPQNLTAGLFVRSVLFTSVTTFGVVSRSVSPGTFTTVKNSEILHPGGTTLHFSNISFYPADVTFVVYLVYNNMGVTTKSFYGQTVLNFKQVS